MIPLRITDLTNKNLTARINYLHRIIAESQANIDRWEQMIKAEKEFIQLCIETIESSK